MNRVLHVVRPSAGGIRRHVLALAAHTDPARFQLSVAAPRGFLNELPDGAFSVAYPLEITARFNLLRDLQAAWLLTRLVPAGAVVHAHGLRAAWIAVLAHAIRPFAFVWTAHNLLLPSRLARLAVKLIGPAAGKVIAISQAVRESLTLNGLPATKITVIPNGIDLTEFSHLPSRAVARHSLGLSPDTFVVACIARLSPEKGIDTLLKALRELPEMETLIAGDGPERRRLTEIAPPNARFLGRLEDIRPLLAAADALAIPSRQEGQGIVALEAMASGIPVVASWVGGLPEMITEGETGLLVPPNDPFALASALRRLRADAPLRAHLAEQGRALVTARYRIGAMAEALMKVYDEK